MKKIFKIGFFLLLAVLPSALKRRILNGFFNAEIHPSAKIGLSYIDVSELKMGEGAVIGHLNVIRGLALVELGDHAVILKGNTITALNIGQTEQFSGEADRFPALILGAHSAIVSKHFIDCNNTVKIGHHTTIAGIGTAFFTHGINIEKNKQESAPIQIGNYAMIGAMCCILKGTVMADGVILAANSTARGNLTQSHALYSGVPAVLATALNPDAAYFKRSKGYVD